MTHSLARLRTELLTDQLAGIGLSTIRDDDRFCGTVHNWAQRRGIALELADLTAALSPAMRDEAAVPIQGWAPQGWCPARCDAGTGFAVEWAHFGGVRGNAPFFANMLHRANCMPLNRLLRPVTTIEAFIADDTPRHDPDGLIFHMSRCGSTLAAQMFGATGERTILSEPMPLDGLVQVPHFVPDIDLKRHVAAVRAMATALMRGCGPFPNQYVLKTDSWHMLAFDLFRSAFPDTPWVFLFRDPLEILVSQARMQGVQMVPGMLPSQLFGLDTAMPGPEFQAGILARIGAAALVAHDRDPKGILVDYADLPDALINRIGPHFGVYADNTERAAMLACARRDAKSGEAFAADGEAKRLEASDDLRALAGGELSDIYAELKMRAIAASASS